jgi:osmotically inducible protein OsmC
LPPPTPPASRWRFRALADAGYPPDELRTSATVTFVPGTGITKSALTVQGRVPNIDEDGFREAAECAKAGCPISQALASVPEIALDAHLEG